MGRNNIKDTEMDQLIASLPQNTTNDVHYFYVIDLTGENEGNICTKSQVAAVKAKGWFPCYTDNEHQGYVEYEGSDETGIDNVITNEQTFHFIFTLSGQRLAEPQKGINIIDGKKVIVK